MTERLLETFFRHKWLIVLPVVLIPLIVGPVALLTAPVYYESWTSIWAERPAYLNYNDGSNNYLTPAQNQSNRLSELVRTRAFQADVARRTSLAPLLQSRAGEQRLQRLLNEGLGMIPSGNNLLVLRFRGETPRQSVEVLNAIVEAFREKMISDRTSQAGLTIAFHEGRLKEVEAQLSKSSEAIRRYVAANPRLTAIDPARGAAATTAARLGLPAVATDPELAELIRRVETDQREVDRARSSLEQARLDISASLEGQELGFQLVDSAQPAVAPTRELRKRLVFPAAGLVGGLGLGAILLVILTALDRTVRSELDLAPAARVVGAVPRLRVAGLPRRAGTNAMRRAIGFPAGTALPAPRGGQ